MSNPPPLSLVTEVESDPVTRVGNWVKISGKVKQDASLVATEISSLGGTRRERLKLRGAVQSIDVPGNTLTIMGLTLSLTKATEIEDLKGSGLTLRDLRVPQRVIVYAKRSEKVDAWFATRIRLTNRLSDKWHFEGVITNREHRRSGLAMLEVGPLKVTIGKYTYVADIEYRAARVAPFNPSTWQQTRRELIWSDLAKLDPESGFGRVARHLILGLERLDVDITIAPAREKAQLGLERFYKPLDHWGKLGFYYHWWFHPSVLKCEKVINYSMWDTTRIPQQQVDEINAVAALQYVPCRQNAESFRECGVRVPIKVLHHGVDPQLFPYLERDTTTDFTFGTFGDLSPRKGIDLLIRAFQDEFRLTEPVRLLMKSTSSMDAYTAEDPRIRTISRRMGHTALLELLREMDAFVMPSRGEGFGLCGLEAMSTGLPLIATNWSGPAEYLDADDSLPLSYRLVEAGGTRANSVSYFGLWAEPDYEHLRYLMRWVYEHREEAAGKGRVAAARVHENWTWDRVAQQVVDDLDALVCGDNHVELPGPAHPDCREIFET